MNLFRHIYQPLAELFPAANAAELGVTARSLFSAVHGMVLLGLEQKLIAVPVEALRKEIATIVRRDGRWADGETTSLDEGWAKAQACPPSDVSRWWARLRFAHPTDHHTSMMT